MASHIENKVKQYLDSRQEKYTRIDFSQGARGYRITVDIDKESENIISWLYDDTVREKYQEQKQYCKHLEISISKIVGYEYPVYVYTK